MYKKKKEQAKQYQLSPHWRSRWLQQFLDYSFCLLFWSLLFHFLKFTVVWRFNIKERLKLNNRKTTWTHQTRPISCSKSTQRTWKDKKVSSYFFLSSYIWPQKMLQETILYWFRLYHQRFHRRNYNECLHFQFPLDKWFLQS